MSLIPHLIKSGVIKSRIDHRDYEAEAIFHEEKLAGSPASPFLNKNITNEFFLFDEDCGADLTIGGNKVYDQGASFRCVAYVGCTMREKQVYNEMSNLAGAGAGATNQHRQYTPTCSHPKHLTPYAGAPLLQQQQQQNKKITFSKDYLYDLRANGFTDGMSGSDLMQILVNYGCVEECDYDTYLHLYNSIADLERKKRGLDSEAHADQLVQYDELIHDEQNKMNELIYRIKNDGSNGDVYAKVTTVNGLKESLSYNGPCLIILPFYGNPNTVEFWLPPDNNSVDEMGHAVTVVGYSDTVQSFYVRNTWGPKWNGTGHFWFPYSSLKLAWEVWTVFPKGTEHLSYHKKRKFSDSVQPNLYAGAALNAVGTTKSKKSRRKKTSKSAKTDKLDKNNGLILVLTKLLKSKPIQDKLRNLRFL